MPQYVAPFILVMLLVSLRLLVAQSGAHALPIDCTAVHVPALLSKSSAAAGTAAECLCHNHLVLQCNFPAAAAGGGSSAADEQCAGFLHGVASGDPR
jgi:hypothetical protein